MCEGNHNNIICQTCLATVATVCRLCVCVCVCVCNIIPANLYFIMEPLTNLLLNYTAQSSHQVPVATPLLVCSILKIHLMAGDALLKQSLLLQAQAAEHSIPVSVVLCGTTQLGFKGKATASRCHTPSPTLPCFCISSRSHLPEPCTFADLRC